MEWPDTGFVPVTSETRTVKVSLFFDFPDVLYVSVLGLPTSWCVFLLGLLVDFTPALRLRAVIWVVWVLMHRGTRFRGSCHDGCARSSRFPAHGLTWHSSMVDRVHVILLRAS